MPQLHLIKVPLRTRVRMQKGTPAQSQCYPSARPNTQKLAVSDENVCRKVRKTYIIFKSSLYCFHFHGSISVPCLYHGITYRNLEEMSNPFYQKIDFSTVCCRTIPIVQPIFGTEDDKTENPSALSVFMLN